MLILKILYNYRSYSSYVYEINYQEFFKDLFSSYEDLMISELCDFYKNYSLLK